MILADLRDWLLGEGFAGDIAVKPDGVDDGHPYWMIFAPSTEVDGGIEDVDGDRHPLVQIKSVGNSTTQALALHGRMHDRAKAYGAPGVQLVSVENESGPHRDDDRWPGPHAFYVDLFVRIRTTPTP